jgi:hypothetical protein
MRLNAIAEVDLRKIGFIFLLIGPGVRGKRRGGGAMIEPVVDIV